MMITIHGFPADIKYPDMKMLIKRECKIEDFMLGTLVKENDGTKKVRIGLSDDNEGYMVMKCLNGYRMGGNYVLKAVPVGKSTPNPPPQNTFESRQSFSGNQQRYDYPNQSRSDYQSRNDYQNTPSNSYGNRGPQGPGPHGPSGGHGSGGGHGPGGGHAPSGGHGSGGGHGPGGGVGPGGGHGPGSQGPMNARQSQWASNNNSPAPWATNTPTANQAPQNNFNYQPQQNIPPFGQQNSSLSQRPEPRQFPQGRAQDRPFGFQPKTVPPNLGPSRQLRNIETVETNTDAPHGRYQPSGQYQQDKPVTIMKDNFQGPTQFNISHPGGQPAHYPEQKPSWQHHGAQQKPQQYTKPTPVVYEKPYDDRKYPPSEAKDTKNPLIRPDTYKEYEKTGRGYSPGRPSGMRGSPIERRLSPPVRRVSPPGRRISPTGRRVSPPGRRISPPGRRISPPGRRISPPGRRASPPGRRVSPPARMTSPQGRRVSPPGRRFSPSARRISPNERRVSPPGRRAAAAPGDSPARPSMRYSPGRHHPDKASDKYGHDKNGKQVRPAYEPPSQAPNQAMYSGGYRPSVHENVQYPVASSRPVDPQRSPWQHDRDEYMKKQDDDRRGPRMDIPRERVPEKIGDAPRQGPIRKSRSPVRRDRSPIRDRFKRHSPSPRSPRRSWALEKRRSPEMTDAPPPPIWPGQSREDRPAEYRHPKPFPDREPADPTPHPHFRPTFQKVEVHVPKWERPIDEDRSRRPEEERRFSKPIREERAPSHERYQPRDHRESKFIPREEFDVERRPTDHRRQDEPSYREDVPRRPRDEDRFPIEERRPRGDSPRREIREKLLKTHTIDKDFEDIYNRALQFKKKAEELRRSSSRRGDSEEVRSEKDRYDRRYREEERPRQERDDRYKREDAAEEPRVKRFTLSPSVKAKRERATEEIALKIMGRHADFNQLKGEQKQRVLAELNLAVARIVFDMFGDKDVSFIEIVVKYQAKFSSKDEEKILQDVVSSLPSQFRNIKRHAPETSEVPAKMARRSTSPGMKQEQPMVSKFSEAKISDWTILEPPKVVAPVSLLGVPPIAPIMNPMMVPSPYMGSFNEIPHSQLFAPVIEPSVPQDISNEFHPSLYLCKDDFGPFVEGQAELLKNFIITQIFQVSETSQGWSPDITLKGLQSMMRYEILANDNMSRDWLLNLDFSEFRFFNVLVYSKEELWYERAAIWLPGHSRSRKLEPLEKLKLQNKKLHGVNIGKWKFVKKIVTAKGTRLYVDMPPSSARALDKHKMMLSYELQKVNVFLKAVAVDKDAFDAGMSEAHITNPAEIATAIQNTPIPSLNYDPSVVKVTLKGAKTVSLAQTRKIKEVIIYHLFKYHQEDGICATDFTKYGFIPPNYFGIVPDNAESKRWLMARQFGKIGKSQILVLGDDDDNTRFFKMIISIPYEFQTNMAIIIEKLKHSNQGVKGLNFNLWKPIEAHFESKRSKYEVDIDLESVETLIKMDYHLDYVDQQTSSGKTASFKSEYYSDSELEEVIKKFKSEMSDIYDDATMDLASDGSGSDVICLN